MTARELIDELERILKVHPEAEEAHIWAVHEEGDTFPLHFVGFTKRRKPPRLTLEM